MNRIFVMHLSVVVLSLVLVVTLSDAYNFNDPVYNQVLADEWEDITTEEEGHDGIMNVVVNPRNRRDEEAVNMSAISVSSSLSSPAPDKCHNKKRTKFCCAEESLLKAHEADKQIKRECYKQITGKDKSVHNFFMHNNNDPFKCDAEKVEKAKREMTCVAQCLGDKKRLLDASGNLLDDKVREEVKSKFESESWLTPKLDEIIDKCLAEAKKAPGKSDDNGNCNGAGIQFGHCFWKELQFSCPVEQIKDLKACDKVRDRINNHPEFPYPMIPNKPSSDEE